MKKSKKRQTAHTAVLTPDHTHLISGHHKVIVATLALLPQLQAHSTRTQSTDAAADQLKLAEGVVGAYKGAARTGGMAEEGLDAQQMKLLLVGLGGGALPMFINKCIPNVSCCDFTCTCISMCISQCHVCIVTTY